MKCFYLREQVQPGIRVRLDKEVGEAYVQVGEKRFLVSKTIRDSVTVVLAEAEKALKEGSLTKEERRRLNSIVNEGWVPLHDADLVVQEGYTRLCKPHGKGSSCSLVVVDTMTSEEGQVTFRSRSYVEWQTTEFAHVRRTYDTWPPVGIKEVQSDGWSKLLIMSPRSGFRIERTGDLEGAAPVLNVSWSGYGLKLSRYYPHGQRRQKQN